MNKFSIIITSALMLSCTPQEEQVAVKMDYTLDWRTDHLHVSLAYAPTEADSTTLHYGEISYGGQADIFSCVKNFQGENCTLVTDNAAREIKLYYEGTPTLMVEYDMEYDLEDEKLNCPRELFRPNTDKDFLYVQGLNLYLHEKGEKDYLQRVSWRNKPDFPTFCMYNEDGSFDTKVAPQSEFYYKFILGDRRLQVDSFELYGVTNYMVTAPLKNADFNRADIKDFFQKVYTGYQKFWNDTIDYSYTLVMYPFEKIRHEVTGLGLGHAFLSRYNHYADTILTKDRATTVAHEIGHNWVSGEQWFGEGFNDLQTWYILTATGLRTIDDYVGEINSSCNTPGISRTSIHSCHRRLTCCASTNNGWQDSCHPPFAPATDELSPEDDTSCCGKTYYLVAVRPYVFHRKFVQGDSSHKYAAAKYLYAAAK